MGFRVPVLIIFWRRPSTVQRVIDAVRPIAPQRVFLAGDGPSPERPQENILVAETRNMVETQIDWPCRIERLYSATNQGCRRAVEAAINWFFQQEQEGIILEDDCVPHPEFFSFCSGLLQRYRDDARVGCITGNNFQNGIRRSPESYYFSKYPHCWGWATWRRAWSLYSQKLEFWPAWRKSEAWFKRFNNPAERRYWQSIFDQAYIRKIDSWAYPWTASLWHAGRLTATPQVNLVQNVGFGSNATHTKGQEAEFSVPSEALGPIVHPAQVIINQEADEYVFRNLFFRGSAVHGGKMIREAKKIWKFIGGMAKKLRTEF